MLVLYVALIHTAVLLTKNTLPSNRLGQYVFLKEINTFYFILN